MPDEATDNTAPVDESTADSGEQNEAPATEATPEEVPSGDESLGDAGKKALDAMKADRNKYRDELKQLREEFGTFKARAEGKEAEHAAAVEQQRVKDEALSAANLKIAKANLRAEAAGKLADPTDALTFIDPSEFEVDDDGNVDPAALTAAVEDLIKNKPYLAAQGKRFEGGADGGARKESVQTQLTQDDLSRMSSEEINTARAEGRLNDLLGIK